MIRLLATGFDSFPGVEGNPSSALMTALGMRGSHFARLGIQLETQVLPVVYEGLPERLATLVRESRPQAILHFGVAARRTSISIETRARNFVNVHVADARGKRPASPVLDKNRPGTISVRIPADQIAAQIRAAGIAAKTSRNAGSYLCNAVLFHTLTLNADIAAGFIHIPIPQPPEMRSSRPSFADIVSAADIALVAMAAHVRHTGALAAAFSSR